MISAIATVLGTLVTILAFLYGEDVLCRLDPENVVWCWWWSAESSGTTCAGRWSWRMRTSAVKSAGGTAGCPQMVNGEWQARTGDRNGLSLQRLRGQAGGSFPPATNPATRKGCGLRCTTARTWTD